MNEIPVVIVTGASRGLGAAVARWIGKARAAVTVAARSAEALKATADSVEALGGHCEIVVADVSDPNACRKIVDRSVARFGRLDALVNNAGVVGPLEILARSDPADWRYNLEVNLLGPVYLCMAALPALRTRRGRIVNVSSGAADRVIQAAGAYCAAKAALNHFTRILAAEEPQIITLAVRPGVVDTTMQETLRRLGPEKMPPDQARYYQALKERGELEPPQVPARSIAWLALSAPHWMSGAFLSYDDEAIMRPAQEFFGETYHD